jgi:hypothetical protein
MKNAAWISAFFCLVAPILLCQSPPSALKGSHAHQVQVIRALVAQADSEKASLRQMLNETPTTQIPKSRIGLMLHAARDAQLNAPGWSKEILASLPTSDLEMEAFLEFTLDRGNKEFEPLFRLYYAMAFKAAALHPEALPKIFRISREFETQNWPDYDDVDWFCSELKETRRANPSAFSAALRMEKHEMRSYIAGCADAPPQ